jgi:2-C-methyl-D-erythritol 4-phosphate cytidylyltransferase
MPEASRISEYTQNNLCNLRNLWILPCILWWSSLADSGKVGAIVVAAGESRRMGGVDKIFVPLMGQPLIAYSLKALNELPQVDDIVLVLSSASVERGRRLVEANGWRKVRDVCIGGQRRQDSVQRGLERLPDSEWVIVHDGARPFIDADMVLQGLAEARQTGAAIAVVPVKDTIKEARDGLVSHTLPRDRLWAVQTPQVFRRELLEEAHRRISDDVTDDASMIERLGGKVRIFAGSYYNIKVTTPEDLPIAEAILGARTLRSSP